MLNVYIMHIYFTHNMFILCFTDKGVVDKKLEKKLNLKIGPNKKS